MQAHYPRLRIEGGRLCGADADRYRLLGKGIFLRQLRLAAHRRGRQSRIFGDVENGRLRPQETLEFVDLIKPLGMLPALPLEVGALGGQGFDFELMLLLIGSQIGAIGGQGGTLIPQVLALCRDLGNVSVALFREGSVLDLQVRKLRNLGGCGVASRGEIGKHLLGRVTPAEIGSASRSRI
jgi:hypothetical protein